MGSLEVNEGKKKWPNLNACRKSNNWDEPKFIPNETSALMGLGHSDWQISQNGWKQNKVSSQVSSSGNT
jgi:hypothetical protein